MRFRYSGVTEIAIAECQSQFGDAGSMKDPSRAKRLNEELATLRTDVPLKEDIPSLQWRGANRAELTALCRELDALDILDRVPRWRE